MSELVALRGGALGDFVLTLPALAALRERFHGARLALVAAPRFGALALRCGLVDAAHSLDDARLAGFFGAETELDPDWSRRFERAEAVVSFLPDRDGLFAANLARAGARRVATAAPSFGARPAHVSLAEALAPLGIAGPFAPPRLELAPCAYSGPRPLVALHPGSGGARKNWPRARWLGLATALLESGAARALLWVLGEVEADFEIPAALSLAPHALLRELPLHELAARLASVDHFVGHDSGVSHLAAAVGARCALLFGPTDPAVWAPVSPRVRVLRATALDSLAVADATAFVGAP